MKAISLANSTTAKTMRSLTKYRPIIGALAKSDFRNRYIGSVLGIFWAFFQPLAMLLILWVVLVKGMKATPAAGFPFIPWFFPAMIAWNFIAECLLSAPSALSEYAFLVKKMSFNVYILPAVKLVSSLMVHLIFLLILFCVLILNEIYPSWSWLGTIYYLVYASLLLLGISWLTSALNIFIKDVAQVVNIFVQFGFWVTPIIWDFNVLPDNLRTIFKLNPAYFVVEGYRKSLVYQTGVFDFSPVATAYYWAICGLILVAGGYTFKKLSPHFADVI